MRRGGSAQRHVHLTRSGRGVSPWAFRVELVWSGEPFSLNTYTNVLKSLYPNTLRGVTSRGGERPMERVLRVNDV